jgi:hypothetical protein
LTTVVSLNATIPAAFHPSFNQFTQALRTAADALLRDVWSRLPLIRPPNKKGAGKQEVDPVKANSIVTPVVDGQTGTADRWQFLRGLKGESALRALVRYFVEEEFTPEGG